MPPELQGRNDPAQCLPISRCGKFPAVSSSWTRAALVCVGLAMMKGLTNTCGTFLTCSIPRAQGAGPQKLGEKAQSHCWI